MTDERITDEQMDEVVSNLKGVSVFGPLDTEDRDAAINLITQLRDELDRLHAENARLREALEQEKEKSTNS